VRGLTCPFIGNRCEAFHFLLANYRHKKREKEKQDVHKKELPKYCTRTLIEDHLLHII